MQSSVTNGAFYQKITLLAEELIEIVTARRQFNTLKFFITNTESFWESASSYQCTCIIQNNIMLDLYN